MTTVPADFDAPILRDFSSRLHVHTFTLDTPNCYIEPHSLLGRVYCIGMHGKISAALIGKPYDTLDLTGSGSQRLPSP
jgi:hypothetical protein